MTITFGPVSWKYLLLFLGGSHCFVDIQQSTRRTRTRTRKRCMLTRIQRSSSWPFLDHDTTHFSQNTICAMASHHRRRSSINRASVEFILTSGEPSQPAAPPSPHVGDSPNRAHFAMSPPARPTPSHSRALSYTLRNPNRLSLSFPVATSSNSNESSRPTPTSSDAQSFPPTPADPSPLPNDSNGFLVALAGQERRVLELKEELQKAEDELKRLKKQWANHEAHKKKAEIRHFEQLQPLQTVVTGGSSDESEVKTRQSSELDRRKAILSNLNIPKDSPKESRRKFSGAHTRALSLLSPERSNFTQPFPPVQESGSENSGFPRSTTMPDTSQGITKVSSRHSRNSYHGGVTHGAKQIAEDVKAGLWTFLEDLRQATVGDEAVHGSPNRTNLDASNSGTARRGSKTSLLSNERKRDKSPRGLSPRTWDSLTGSPALLDAAGSMWSDDQLRTSKTPKKTNRPLSLAAPNVDDLDDDWSNWDSPTPKSPRWSGSTTMSDPATPSNGSVEDSNVKYVSAFRFPAFINVNNHRIIGQSTDEGTPSKQQRDEIQWPALDKLSPGNLKGNLQRTMSTIMKEWEKSITPPPGHREDSINAVTSKEPSGSSTQDEVLMMFR